MKHCKVAMLKFDDLVADNGIKGTLTDNTGPTNTSSIEKTDTGQTEGPNAPAVLVEEGTSYDRCRPQ
jgi:hypothetical protein